jgi:proline dehydrogenase
MGAMAVLGEFVERRDEVENAIREVEELLAGIEREKLDSYVHVKPTHFGLKIDKRLCLDSLRRLLTTARAHGVFVRLDMEDSPCVDDTLEMHAVLAKEFDNVGAVLQARLRRSLADARQLGQMRANVRVCKGIYVEPYAIAYQEPETVRRNFIRLVEELMAAGCYVAVATHDELVVWEANRVIDRLKPEPSRYEFQMLLGVAPPLRRAIRATGHRLRVAVPYGPQWYAYSMRRFRENPAMAGHVMRAFFKRAG